MTPVKYTVDKLKSPHKTW